MDPPLHNSPRSIINKLLKTYRGAEEWRKDALLFRICHCCFFSSPLVLRRGDPRTLIRAGFKTADTCFKKAVTQAKKNKTNCCSSCFSITAKSLNKKHSSWTQFEPAERDESIQ